MDNKKGIKTLNHIEKVSKLLDSQFTVGGFKFGLDPILNLIPFAGDGVTALVSLALVYTMKKHGASGKLIAKMLGNVLIDFTVGAIPILGWVFDFYFKANDRNVKLLKAHYAEGKHSGSANGYLAVILTAFLLVMILVMWGVWVVLKWFFGMI